MFNILAKIKRNQAETTFGTKLLNVIFIFKPIFCKECNKEIENDELIYFCSDFEYYCHKNCFNNEHIKKSYVKIAEKQFHYDHLGLIKMLDEEDYNKLELEEVNL